MYYALKKSGHTLKKMTSRLLLRSLVQLVLYLKKTSNLIVKELYDFYELLE